MLKYAESDNKASNPINLDAEQFKELERIITCLKKEIVFPEKLAPRRRGQPGRAENSNKTDWERNK